MRAQPLGLCLEPSWTEIGTYPANGECGNPFLELPLGPVAIAMEPQDAEHLGAVSAKSGEHGIEVLAVVLPRQLHQGSEGRGWFELVRLDQAAQFLSRMRYSASGQESRAFADEELAFLAVECYSIRPCQADAMTR